MHGADDVDERVERADFVQVHSLDRNSVDCRFSLSKPLKKSLGALLTPWAERRPVDQVVNLGNRSMGAVVVMHDLLCTGPGRVRVRMCVMVMMIAVVVIAMVVGVIGDIFPT